MTAFRRALARCRAQLLALALLPFMLGNAQAAPLEVVTSFSLLGDLVQQVGGERVAVRSLVGPDEDAHSFQPRPSDARQVGAAKVVVVNGLGFDDWLVRLAGAAGYRGPLVVASDGVATLATEEAPGDEHGHDHDHGHQHGEHGIDPHAWQDVANVRRYVANIAAALAAADPAGAEAYRASAASYDARLQALDADIRRTLGALPPARRKVVSSHAAFAYFGRAYGIRFLAPVGVANSAEPTARGVASLITQIRREKVPAVFLENVTDPRLLERIRSEGGARVGGTLYSDALSPAGGPAPDYISMMRHNLDVMSRALVGGK